MHASLLRMKIVLTLALICVASTSKACVTGAKCITIPESQRSESYEIGDVLPRGKYQMMINSRYNGLPKPDQGTLYFKVDHRVLRVELNTLMVVEDMTYVAGRVAR